MATFKIESLADDVEIAALVLTPITRHARGNQGDVIGTAHAEVPKLHQFTLDSGDEVGGVVALGRVNRTANPALPAVVGTSIDIDGVLRVTKTSD